MTALVAKYGIKSWSFIARQLQGAWGCVGGGGCVCVCCGGCGCVRVCWGGFVCVFGVAVDVWVWVCVRVYVIIYMYVCV